MVKNRIASRPDRGAIIDKDSVLKTHSEQYRPQQRSTSHQQQTKSSSPPNITLFEAKKRGKLLKIQQQEQLRQVMSSEGESVSQGKEQISIAVPPLAVVKDIYQNVI